MDGKRSVILLALVVTGFLLLAGCTSTSPEDTAVAPVTTTMPTNLPPTLESTHEPVQVQEPDIGTSNFDGSVVQPPDDLTISVSAQKDPVYNQITVVFDGGKGQQLVRDITVRVTTSDGMVSEQPLDVKRGSEAVFSGTKGNDRVQVAVNYKNGESYLIFDQIVGQIRAPEMTETPTPAPVPESSEGGKYDGPVTQPPKNLLVSVDVDKDPVYRVITATFRGGHGQTLVKMIEVHALLSDGSEVTEELSNNIGGEAEIQGTNGNDKVQVVVFYKNGEQYKISEKVFGPRG